MLRIVVSEAGQGALPAIDLDGVVTIGSGAAARVRLPAGAIAAEHVRIEAGRWRALAEVRVDGALCEAGEAGDVAAGVDLELDSYRVRVAPAPAGAVATPPQRTESLARELMRSLLGTGAAPSLTVERGPAAGGRRVLAPPESVLVIGRGDEAGWILADDDLSRAHAEIRRGWDGVRVVDLGSKNGTKLDGEPVAGEVALRDGARLELGNVTLRFRDPAEQHVGTRAQPAVAPAVAASPRATPVFYAALAILALALGGLVWLATTA